MDKTFKVIISGSREEEEPQIIGFFDGSSANESGKWVGGIGAVAYYNGSKIVEISEPIGEATNNAAEYTALIRLLESLLLYSHATITINGDSQLVINQVNGLWDCKKPTLVDLLAQVNMLKKEFRSICFQWVERSQNSEADSLSGKATRKYKERGLGVWNPLVKHSRK